MENWIEEMNDLWPYWNIHFKILDMQMPVFEDGHYGCLFCFHFVVFICVLFYILIKCIH